MKFYCNGNDLASATNVVSKALSFNKAIPLLECIRIYAKGTFLTLSATNQELFIEKQIKADIELEGEIIVNGKIFSEYTNKLANKDRICIEQDRKDSIALSFDNNEIRLKCSTLEKFPSLGDFENGDSFIIKENDFKESIEKIIFCVGTQVSASQPLLNALQIRVKEDIIECACLDGYKVGVSRKPIEGNSKKYNILVNGKTINEIGKILSDSEEKIKVINNKNMLLIDFGHTKIRTSTLEGKYFDFEKIININVNNEVVVKKDELIEVVTRSLIISKDSLYTKLTIKLDEDMIEFYANSEKGNSTEVLKCKNSGTPLTIAINNKYLLDAVSKIKEDFLKLEIADHRTPVIIKQIDKDDVRFAIQLIKLT